MCKKIILILTGILIATSFVGCQNGGGAETFQDMKEIKNVSWQAVQAEEDSRILQEISNGSYTPENPFVIVDPYDVAPLTALVAFDTDEETAVSITIPGKTADTTFVHDFNQMKTHHEIPVYGLYGGQVNDVEIVLTTKERKQEKYIVPVETESLPADMAPYEIEVNKPEAVGELLYISSATDAFKPFAVDKQGDIRWYSSHNTFSAGVLRRTADDKFLAFTEGLYAPAFIRSGVVKVDRMGKVYAEYLKDYCHHDAVELPSGNLLLASIKPESASSENGMTMGQDILVEIEQETGEEVRTWDLNEISGYAGGRPNIAAGEGDAFAGEYLHINSVYYDPTDNSIVVSSPTMKVVLKFDADTKEIIWAIGDPRHDYPDVIAEKIPTPVGQGFEWNGAQHAATILPSGDIMMDDNGSGRLDSSGKYVEDKDNYSRLLIYRINEEKNTIEQVYQYGKERGNELFATYLGDADYLGQNHYLLNAGGRIVGDDGIAQGRAFDVMMGIKNGEAKIVEVLNNKVVFEMKVGGVKGGQYNVYRVEKDAVYANDEKEYDLSKNKSVQFGELLPTETVDFDMPNSTEELVVEADCTNLGYQLSVSVKPKKSEKTDKLFVELKGTTETKYYPVSGMGSGYALIRAAGLESDEFAVGIVMQKEDGTVQYKQIGEKWVVERN